MILLCWKKWYSICLISFFNLFELFRAFVCANKIESLVNNLFGVKNFDPVTICFFEDFILLFQKKFISNFISSSPSIGKEQIMWIITPLKKLQVYLFHLEFMYKHNVTIVMILLFLCDKKFSLRRGNINIINSLLKSECPKYRLYTYNPKLEWFNADDGSLNESLFYSDNLHLVKEGDEVLAKEIVAF